MLQSTLDGSIFSLITTTHSKIKTVTVAGPKNTQASPDIRTIRVTFKFSYTCNVSQFACSVNKTGICVVSSELGMTDMYYQYGQ